MTKTQFRRKFSALIRQERKNLARFAEAALRENPDLRRDAPDNFAFPKNVLCAAYEQAASPSGYGFRSPRGHAPQSLTPSPISQPSIRT